ncbi:MAG: hypothetical protein M3T56_12750, partial [Chloroflexota bacterium]|nr:hypothetical protein [Chloroflexota bacterium]
MERVLAIFGTIRAEPADAEEIRLRKALLVASGFLISVLAIFWGLLYILLGGYTRTVEQGSHCQRVVAQSPSARCARSVRVLTATDAHQLLR